MPKRLRFEKSDRRTTTRPNNAGLTIEFNPPVLRSERLADFQALHEALTHEIKPRGIIEEMYVNDIACFVWEIVRLRRCKTSIINTRVLPALESLLASLTKQPMDFLHEDRARELALNWFSDKDAKKEVRQLLCQFGLDKSAIEAEAIRQLSRDLETIEKMLMAFEARRDKALASIALYRSSLARQLRESSDRLIDAECNLVPRLEDASVTTSPE
jgi:hypothetical protein